jgi:hypothetical protein
MKHMKQIAIIAIVIVTAAAGYMAYQRYYANHDNVKVQFLNFGGTYEDGDDLHHHNSSYNAGYAAGMKDCQNS